jgi:hypothetical protein
MSERTMVVIPSLFGPAIIRNRRVASEQVLKALWTLLVPAYATAKGHCADLYLAAMRWKVKFGGL